MHKFKGGDGEFVTGLPAHDISDEEFDTLTDEQRGILKAHMASDNPLYEESKAEKDAADAPVKKASGSVDAKKASG